jgi:hypothetical protein
MNNTKNIITEVPFTYKTDNGYLTIYQGRISNVVGFYTPAEYKKAIKIYYAIINKK